MKVFVTGVCGQLGHDVVNELLRRGHEAVGSDIAEKYSGADDGSAVVSAPYEQLDITDGEAVRTVLTRVKPDAVVHCAAWTAVDAAEDEENKAKVYAINADGTKNEDYCIYCFKDGEFTSDMTMDEMMNFCIEKMVEVHPDIDEAQASAMMSEVFPKLKRWAND